MAAGTLCRRFVTVDDPRWRQAHGSTVLALPDGTLLAAWFAGTREGAGDTSIWLARRPAGEYRWRPPWRVLDELDEPHWNPVLCHGPDGRLWLFAKRGRRISRWTTWVRTSLDGGLSWSPAQELVPGGTGGRGPVRNPPLVLLDGTWLAPASRETWVPETAWEAFVDRSVAGPGPRHLCPWTAAC